MCARVVHRERNAAVRARRGTRAVEEDFVGAGTIAVVVGNPKPASRTRAVAELVAGHLATICGAEVDETIDLADHGPALLGWGDPEVAALKERVLTSAAVVVASPTYKACFTGLLKLFLDQFDAGELSGSPTVAVMTGGSAAHSLAVDVHLVPVLSEIGASLPARGLYVAGPEIEAPDDALARWQREAAGALARALGG
jgi:FMN reductase